MRAQLPSLFVPARGIPEVERYPGLQAERQLTVDEEQWHQVPRRAAGVASE